MGLSFCVQYAELTEIGFSYSGFNEFRNRIARYCGFPNAYPDTDGDIYKNHRWKELESTHPMYSFLTHSDCDGEMSPDECGEGEVFDTDSDGKYSEIHGKFLCGYHAFDCGMMVFCDDCGDEVSEKQYSKKFDMYLCDKCKKKREFLEGITKDSMKEFSLELFTYLRDNPGRKGRKNLPDSIKERLEFIDKKCPLCMVFRPDGFERFDNEQKKRCNCNGCPLGKYANCIWRKKWLGATNERTRHKYTLKIIELIENWSTKNSE